MSSWLGLEVDRTTCMPFAQNDSVVRNTTLMQQYQCTFPFKSMKVYFLLIMILLHLNRSGGARLHAKLKTESYLNQKRASGEASMNFPRSSDCAFSGARAAFWRSYRYVVLSQYLTCGGVSPCGAESALLRKALQAPFQINLKRQPVLFSRRHFRRSSAYKSPIGLREKVITSL